MKGNIPQKALRLLAHLISQPQYLPRCVSHNLLNDRSPLDLEIPWFSYAAIDFLEKFLKPHMRVFEYGSGGSTLFFAKRVNSVFSIEDNPQWYDRVVQRLRDKRIENADLKFCPFDFKNPVGFETSDYLLAIPKEKFDIIVIDGSEEWTQVRPVCFRHAETHIQSGGLIVVDDSWRYPDLRLRNNARRHTVFQSVGPCRPGVTSTDVFFY